MLKTNVKLDETRDAIRKDFGEAISLLPGKSERWLCTVLEDGLDVSLAGSTSPCAMIFVDQYGSANRDACNRLAGRLTDIMEERLHIPPDRVYVAFHETGMWAWQGELF
ncbi:MAG: hypothetical protein IJ083_03635 [Clostridia bacterium]|nr:hypothetical protein [Clostridia bacterium]